MKANTIYQVWALVDDLNYAQEHQQEYADCKYLETEQRGVALWFAVHYPFEFTENTMIRVEEVEIDNNGDEHCVDILMEFPLVRE